MCERIIESGRIDILTSYYIEEVRQHYVLHVRKMPTVYEVHCDSLQEARNELLEFVNENVKHNIP